MTKLRTGTPWKPAGEYSKELGGLTVNLLVRDMPRATAFAREVLQATIVYEDPDFAALEAQGAKWCLHADHTYSDHPLSGSLAETEIRASARNCGCWASTPMRRRRGRGRRGMRCWLARSTSRMACGSATSSTRTAICGCQA